MSNPLSNAVPFAEREFVHNGDNAKLSDALYNDSDPAQRIKAEKLNHRLMAWMAANGHNNTEIAKACECAAQTVSYVLRQPFIREKILQFQREVGQEELTRLFRPEAKNAFLRMVKRASDTGTPAAVAQRSDEYIMNRYLGNPKDSIEVNTKPLDSMSREELLDVMKQEIEREKQDSLTTTTKTIPTPQPVATTSIFD